MRTGKVRRLTKYRNWGMCFQNVGLNDGIPRLFLLVISKMNHGKLPGWHRRGQCGTYGHCLATCMDEVQLNCFECFMCGVFDVVLSDFPEYPTFRQTDDRGWYK